MHGQQNIKKWLKFQRLAVYRSTRSHVPKDLNLHPVNWHCTTCAVKKAGTPQRYSDLVKKPPCADGN